MGSSIHINRRSFIKTLACGTAITLSFSGLPINILPQLVASEKNGFNNPMWAPVPGVASMRIDGLPKVLGHKIYARDFHASDMNGWPNTEKFLYALRVDKVDRVVNGYDLSILPPELQPMKIVDHAIIMEDNMALAGGMAKPFFVENGKLPDHYGQPVAIFIFENFDSYRKAKDILQFNNLIIKYGETKERPVPENYAPASGYVRDDDEQFNYVNNVSDYDERISEIASKIESEIASSDWNIFERQFKSQSMDPVFMEPESGLAWYDKHNGTLQLLLGTQSPSGDLSKIADIFGNEKCSYPLNSIDLTACYPGGGFGGRDDSYFPKYLALCAVYADGPVRWMHDRYEQFQVGLKRHETDFFERIEIDNGDMTLIDYLHEYQNLTGTKFSCGIGVCRACTVIMQNDHDNILETALSCSTQLSDLEDKKIYTVESIGSEDNLVPLQKAFLEHFSFQCGYCTSGFLMAATTMLDHIQKRGVEADQIDALVDEMVGSNLCRCTGYVRYIDAIKEVALKTINRL